MSNKPKTIITYLVDGNPTGIKTAELSNWIGKAIVIPRSKIKEAKDRGEVKQPAIYFLFGEDENGGKQAYIGEAENLIARLSNHDTNKDFWDTVVAFVSKDNNLTKADVKFLEANAIQQGIKAKRFQLMNAAEPIPNNLPEYQISTMEEFLENIDLLISALGYPILKEISLKVSQSLGDKEYFLLINGCNAKGIYTSEGFIILKGSMGRLETTTSFGGKAQNTRKELFNNSILVSEGGKIIFTNDYVCSSPSHASSLLSGRSSNGWTERKDKNGKTLDENERKSLNS